MEISVVASGSNGNSCLVENKDTSILIDAGKSAKEIELRLNHLGKSLENINGVILTHSHIDHCQSVGVISRRYNVPAYMTKEVYSQIQHQLGKIEVKNFNANKDFKINTMDIKPILTSHDVPSSGFVVKDFGLFTDTGIVTDQMTSAMKNLRGVLLESNHDIDMLINGFYPPYLKQRILSNNGHLSNVHASSFINDIGKNLNFALLGHLSGNNNTPQAAKETFEAIVKRKMDCFVLSRDRVSGIWSL